MFRPPLSRLCFALCLLIGCAAPAYAFDLIQAFEAAQRHSAEYAAAQYGYQAEIEQEAQARAPLLPQISANALYQRQPASLSSNTVSHGWGVQASQVLFDRSLWAQYRQGRQAAQQAAAKLQRSGDDLLFQVAQAYCEVLQQQDTWAAIRQEKAAYFRQMQQARAAFEKGTATRVDIEEARAGYDAALAKEITTVSRLELARSTLDNLTGLDSRQIEPLRPGELPDWLQQKENYWQDLAERHNPQWIEQRWAWQQARSNREAAQGSRWPRLTLNGGYQDHHNTQSYGRADQHYRSKGGSVCRYTTAAKLTAVSEKPLPANCNSTNCLPPPSAKCGKQYAKPTSMPTATNTASSPSSACWTATAPNWNPPVWGGKWACAACWKNCRHNRLPPMPNRNWHRHATAMSWPICGC